MANGKLARLIKILGFASWQLAISNAKVYNYQLELISKIAAKNRRKNLKIS